MYLVHSNFRNLCQKWLLKINIAKPNFRTLFIYQKCSQFDGRYSYIQRYLRAKVGAYRTVCGISGVHNGEAAEFPIHTSLIHAITYLIRIVKRLISKYFFDHLLKLSSYRAHLQLQRCRENHCDRFISRYLDLDLGNLFLIFVHDTRHV